VGADKNFIITCPATAAKYPYKGSAGAPPGYPGAWEQEEFLDCFLIKNNYMVQLHNIWPFNRLLHIN
jgi:hypothetical protein